MVVLLDYSFFFYLCTIVSPAGLHSSLFFHKCVASSIPELFEGVRVESGLLAKLVRTQDTGGCFPSDLSEQLDWFFDNFDCKKAATGQFEPARGMDDNYDGACDALDRIKRELEDYKQEMCSGPLPSSARHAWKYINTKEASKDKYLIELPAHVPVPNDFFVKGKRGSGDKKINKYRSPVVEGLVQELEQAYDVVNAGKKRGMEIVFAKFDSMRSMWATAASATAMLDALGALAEASSQPGLTRPTILDCPPDGKPSVNIVQGRHPCVEITHSGGDFVPNDMSLGGSAPTDDPFRPSDNDATDESRVLLLSGPNMVRLQFRMTLNAKQERYLSLNRPPSTLSLSLSLSFTGWQVYAVATNLPHCHPRADRLLRPGRRM